MSGEQVEASPPPQPAIPPPPQPPPVDLAGRWRLSMVGGAACLMTFTDAPGAIEGSIAPTGGCPANFFTSRKWTYEHDMLIIRDHKGEALAELSFATGRFEGHPTGASRGSIMLARP
jgi:Protease inhibitor Inh